MKTIVKFLLSLIALYGAPAVSYAANNDSRDKKLILINKFVDHPALDETARGIVDALRDCGFTNGETADIRIESAQANSVLASQISTKFANQSPDIVICIGTVSAQSMIKYCNGGRTKMVFSSITDPLGAGLVEKLDKTDKNITGVSNFVPLEPQLELMKKIQPSIRKLGIIYNAGEVNSVTIVNKLQKISNQFRLTIVKQAVTKTSDVSQAAAKLATSVDAVFISNDNTALSCLANIVRICNGANIPVYVSDTDAVLLGALAALGPNQYSVGMQTGKIAAKILSGVDIAGLAVEFPSETELFVNMDAAKILKINIPADVISSASRVITTSGGK
ncbi:MAG: ABC transporter substrate-binding protein [Puniceicoccales bacterium]|jgi:putative ABC transport system substrate-binding protein|nr:ABC transporter substrate-binding protein [Puniceicoccales bacterium]